ncbi:UNVERIFIED_CONTAM: hypothetical protein Slati_1325600 [Sesamum latifolium]|uniref:GRF-type domain-containing protein n=1 Tax=Sesamum latifolium TaxID=2727402 RepID=A0AAW2XH33_9LAMI
MSSVAASTDCYCGMRAMLQTSWTSENPGRRFHACRDFNRGGCRFLSGRILLCVEGRRQLFRVYCEKSTEWKKK